MKMMSTEDEKLLAKCSAALMGDIDLESSSLLAELRARGAITAEQMQLIRSETSESNRVGKLLDILLLGDEDNVDKLIYSLRASGQAYLAKRFLRPPIKPDHDNDDEDDTNREACAGAPPDDALDECFDVTLPYQQMTIHVRDCDPNFYRTNRHEAYDMSKNPRGKALIISIRSIGNFEARERKGTDVDRDNLKVLFEKLAFDVTVHGDLSATGIKEKVQQFAELPSHREAQGCVVAVLGHGREDGVIYGSDGEPVHINALRDRFSNENSPSLVGKPKLFIFDNCGGESETVHEDDHPRDMEVDGASMVPIWSDQLIAYSTCPGPTSWRPDPSKGSWFITALTSVFQAHAHGTDVISMLRMMTKVRTDKTTIHKSEFRSTLTKRFYFFPGINGEDSNKTGLTLDIEVVPKKTKRKRKALTETQLHQVVDSTETLLSDDTGTILTRFRGLYQAPSVRVAHSHHHHNHLFVHIEEMGNIVRFMEDLQSDTLTSIIADLVKGGLSGVPQSWDLVAKVIDRPAGCDDEDEVDFSGRLPGRAQQPCEEKRVVMPCTDDLDRMPGDFRRDAGTVVGAAVGAAVGQLTGSLAASMLSAARGMAQVGGYTPTNGTCNATPMQHQAGYTQFTTQCTQMPIKLTSIKPREPPAQEKRRLTKRHSKTLADIIKDKASTDLQFYSALQGIQGQGISFTELLDEGLNLAHQCLKHNRPGFLKVIQAVGAWQELTEQAAREPSEFSGRTPRQYGEDKRLRRLIRQMDALDQLEASMGDRKAALKYCRAGDLTGLKNGINGGNLDRNPSDSDGNTTVHWACISGDSDTVKHVVNELKVNPKSMNSRMESPLHVAINYGHNRLVDFLITVCHNDPRQIDVNMTTPTQNAAENGDIQCLRQLRNCGVEFDVVTVTKAAKSGSLDCVRFLLDECTLNPQARDTDGKSLLMLAAEKGSLELVKYLVEKKDFNLRDVSYQNRNVLHWVADKGHTEVAQYLIDKTREEGILSSLLNQKDRHKISQLFALVRGLDKGRAAWHYVHLQRRYVSLYDKCTRNGRVDAAFVGTIVKSSWGEEPEVGVLDSALEEYMRMNRTKDGEPDTTPMFLAAAKGHTGVALLLLKAGADVHIVDCFGETPMHMAAMRGHLDLAVELENAGAQLSAPDSDGFTPIRVARENEHPEMANMLCASRMPHVEEFTDKRINSLLKELSTEKLGEVRKSGNDVVRHVINAVRDLQIDINILLQELGSGPVLEESRRQ